MSKLIEISTVVAGVVISVLALGGCASSSLEYTRAKDEGRPGFTETQLADRRYRVTYTGNSRGAVDKVKDFALLRAAELTLLNGHDWFRVVGRESGRQVDERPATTTTFASGHRVDRDCGLLGCTTTVTPQYTGVMVDSTRTRDVLISSIEVVMGNGEIEDPTEVYNAKELRNFLTGKYDL